LNARTAPCGHHATPLLFPGPDFTGNARPPPAPWSSATPATATRRKRASETRKARDQAVNWRPLPDLRVPTKTKIVRPPRPPLCRKAIHPHAGLYAGRIHVPPLNDNPAPLDAQVIFGVAVVLDTHTSPVNSPPTPSCTGTDQDQHPANDPPSYHGTPSASATPHYTAPQWHRRPRRLRQTKSSRRTRIPGAEPGGQEPCECAPHAVGPGGFMRTGEPSALVGGGWRGHR